ncbi:Protein of unknown function [Microbacterium sp. RU33B]|nr:Protein of unknown function [Microbacterium sp. RU33B]
MSSVRALARWIAPRGVAHTSDARAAGFSKHHIARAVESGEVDRIRRSWLAAPGCDPSRRRAASVSGRVTCVSAAAALGLWVHEHDLLHVAVPSTASRLPSHGMRLHSSTPPIAVARTAVEEPLINVLFHVARCVPRLHALAVWESALRAGVASAEELVHVRWRSTRAAELAGVVTHLSHSGVETVFRELMSSIGVIVRQQVWIDGHPLDGVIGELLAIQLDGFAHHSSASDRRRDLRADARLALRGYTTLRFDYQQVLFDQPYVISTVMTAMAQGLHVGRRR